MGYGERAYRRGCLHVRGSGPAMEELIQLSPSYRDDWQPNQNGFTEALFVDHAIEGTRLARNTGPLCPCF